MRIILLVAAMSLAGTALAENELEVKVNRIDMAVTAPDDSDDDSDSDMTMDGAQKQATGHNVTRSNRTSLRSTGNGADYNSSRSNKTHAPAARSGSSPGTRAAPAQDYNSSRSNNSGLAAPAPDGSHNASRSNRSRLSTASPAQDYNSSRSNNGSAGLALHDDDDDGDGVETCRNGVDDDCDDTDVAASPANHNTTRSNRISP